MMKQRICKNKTCYNKFDVPNGNGPRYCSPECKKEQQKVMSAKSRNKQKERSAAIHSDIVEAGIIYELEGGRSWARVLGPGGRD